jgi:hypothetical protein
MLFIYIRTNYAELLVKETIGCVKIEISFIKGI